MATVTTSETVKGRCRCP